LGPDASFRRSPTHDRIWALEHSVLPNFFVRGTTLCVGGFRSFRWRNRSEFEPLWEERRYPLRALRRVWFVLAPFSTGWRGPAHSLLSFEFEDSSFLAISVEARRAVGERFGLLRGMFRSFELIYVAGDEQDLIGVRAVHRRQPVFTFPLRLDAAAGRGLLLSLARGANRLRSVPEFYHTLRNNCLTRLLDHAGRGGDERIPRGWQTRIPGYADSLVHRLGLLDTSGPIEEARQRWHINALASAHIHHPDFSRLIRTG
jgi:hypothetical protein